MQPYSVTGDSSFVGRARSRLTCIDNVCWRVPGTYMQIRSSGASANSRGILRTTYELGRAALRRPGSLSLIRPVGIRQFHQPDACASRSIDAISITATIAFTGVYCSGPARCAVACRTNRTGAGSEGS